MTPAIHITPGPIRRPVVPAIERRFWWVSVLILLFVSFSASAVTSVFSADKVAGCAPLVVNFTPVDAPCSGCTYSWNFGTGSPVTGYTASSSFLTAGVHVVTLTVTSGALSSSSTRTITVYANPTVSFTQSDTAICPGKSVTFSNTSTNGASGPATIKWSLGDGDTAVVSPITHTYMFPGYYNVALSVTNSNGCTTTLTKTTLIHVFTPPVISFTQNKTTVCDPPASVAFTNTSTGSGPLIYLCVSATTLLPAQPTRLTATQPTALTVSCSRLQMYTAVPTVLLAVPLLLAASRQVSHSTTLHVSMLRYHLRTPVPLILTDNGCLATAHQQQLSTPCTPTPLRVPIRYD